MRKPRIAHIATVDATLRFLLLGQLLRLRDEGFEVVGISAKGPWVPDLQREGIRHIAWRSATRAWDPLADARAFRELLGILRREHFDLVHTHNPKPGVIGRIAARLTGVPVVVNTVHGLYASPQDALRRRLPVLAIEWLAARFSDAELFQSAEDLAWVRRLHVVPARRSLHLGNGADLGRFDASSLDPARLAALRERLGLPSNGLVVGTVGRLVREKGYRELFRAARAIRAERPDVAFLVIGPFDPAKKDAVSRAERDAASSDVVFAGWREDVPELLALMDIFVLPSWREGIPRSAIEAAAMGRALILTDIRGCREIARNGIEALLVPPRDPEGLADAIRRLVEDPELRVQISTAAKERALQRFDERSVAARVVDVYRSLLSPRPAAGRSLRSIGLEDVRVRPATPADVPAIADLHATVMDHRAFLPTLGRRFLRSLFLALVKDADAGSFVAERRGEVIGYAAGVVSMRAFRRRFLLRHGVGAALAAGTRTFRPRVLRHVMEVLRYPEATRGLPDAEFAFLGVRRRVAAGLGPELTMDTLRYLEGRGVLRLKAYVDVDNGPMNRMVRRLGFEEHAQIALHDGRPSHLYVYRCRS